MISSLHQLYGNIDIYLFDQLLKGRYDGCNTVLDVGCGGGRNLVYFLRNGFKVYGIDPNAEAIDAVKSLSAVLSPNNSTENFLVATAEDMDFNDALFDVVISSAVLHFANDRNHFEQMLKNMWRVLKPGGYFFARLASDIGIEHLVKDLGQGRYLLPDGSERFLMNEKMLLHYTGELKGSPYEPIKTTIVQSMRSMTTWCLLKL